MSDDNEWARAVRVKQKHVRSLMSISGVLGVGIGVGPSIRVYARSEDVRAKVPAKLGGFPIVVDVTGEIVAG